MNPDVTYADPLKSCFKLPNLKISPPAQKASISTNPSQIPMPNQELEHTQQLPNLTDDLKDQFPEILYSPQTLSKPPHVFPNSTEAPQPQNNSLKHKISVTHITNPKPDISQKPKEPPKYSQRNLTKC